MSDTKAILDEAQARATDHQLSYAGVVTPQEAFAVIQHSPEAVLVDVRTRAELELVGYIPFAQHIEWAFYPGMTPNADFGAQLEANVDKAATLIFICRTGGRSHNAALLAKQLGYEAAYNMTEGFEGAANDKKQRTLLNGWKHADLPWSN